jgi:hypothetical protein
MPIGAGSGTPVLARDRKKLPFGQLAVGSKCMTPANILERFLNTAGGAGDPAWHDNRAVEDCGEAFWDNRFW